MHDPKLEKAFLDSIKHYFDGGTHDNYDQVHGERKFSKAYFDNLDQSLNNPIPEDKKTKKKAPKSNAK